MFSGVKSEKFKEIGNIMEEFEQMSAIDEKQSLVYDEYSNANKELLEVQYNLEMYNGYLL